MCVSKCVSTKCVGTKCAGTKCAGKRDGWERITGPRGSRILGLGDRKGGVSDCSHTDISNSTDNF